MADIAKQDLKFASALPGAITRPFNAGGSGALLDTVIISGATAVQADGSAAPGAYARGIVTSIAGGKESFVTGDKLGVTLLGPVAGFTGMTEGDILYQSDTAGAMADAPGTVSHKVGFAESATVFFVNPALQA